MTRPRRLLLVVDAPSLLHRNHHARSHTGLRDRQGRPIWALHGMLRQILESIDSFAPDAVVFGLDDRSGSLRRDLYPDYKAGRAQKDPDLIDQLDRAGALLDALGLATITPAGPGGRRRQRLGGDLGDGQRLGLRHHHLRPRRLRPHQPPHAGAAPHRRRDPRLADAQPGAPVQHVRRATGQLPGLRRAPRRQQRQPARRAGHRREDGRDPARRRRVDGRRLGRHRPRGRTRPPRPPSTTGRPRPAAAASAPPSYAACRHRVRASATSSTCR